MSLFEFRCPTTGILVTGSARGGIRAPKAAPIEIKVPYCMGCGRRHRFRSDRVSPVMFSARETQEACIAVVAAALSRGLEEAPLKNFMAALHANEVLEASGDTREGHCPSKSAGGQSCWVQLIPSYPLVFMQRQSRCGQVMRAPVPVLDR
jgi:hypothetical protein